MCGIYNKPPLTMAERLAHELSRWLRAKQFKDPQGRDVRANYAIIVEIMSPMPQSSQVQERLPWRRGEERMI